MAGRLDTASWLAVWDSYAEALPLGQLHRYRRRRWGRVLELDGWLSRGELPSLSTERALALYRASGGSRIAGFATSPMPEVRNSLDFVGYHTIKLEGRFSECAPDAASRRGSLRIG